MIDPDAKVRFTWPGFITDEDEGGKGKKVKCKKCKAKKEKEEKKGEEGEGDAEECGCSHLYPCRDWCAGLKACCVSCAEALGECPRCTCFRVRCWCGRLGGCLGGCLARCSNILGYVFSAIVTLAGLLGMALVVYYLWPAILNEEELATRKKMNVVVDPLKKQLNC